MKNLTEEQKMKLYNNLAISFPVIGLMLQILILAVSIIIYRITLNWAYFIIYILVQIGIMPVLLLICGLGGLIFSILALMKICFKTRYVVTIILSVILSVLGFALFPAMLSMIFGIG